MKDRAENSAKHRKLMKKSTMIILVGIVIMGTLSIYVVQKSPSFEEVITAERLVEREKQVSMSLLEMTTTDQWQSVSGTTVGSNRLSFNISSNLPLRVALMASINGAAPVILFKETRMPPGASRLIKWRGERFVYELEQLRANIKFCMLYADDSETLHEMLQGMSVRKWQALPSSQCVVVNNS